MSRYSDIDTYERSGKIRRVRRLQEAEGSFLPWGILPWLGVIALSVYSCTAIQEKTEAVVERELAAQNLDWVEANASGRTITLTGNAPSIEAEARAERIAINAAEKNWLGITFDPVKVRTRFERLAATDINAEDAALPTPEIVAGAVDADWNFVLSDSVLTLNGEVPNEETRLEIVKAAQASIQTPAVSDIRDNLIALDLAAPTGYLNVAQSGLKAISYCDEGIVSFRAKVFEIDCELPRRLQSTLRQELISSIAYGRLGDVTLTATEDVDACEGSLASMLTETKIEFASGSSEINAASQDLLNRVADAAKTCPGTLRIEGHTDSTGSDEKNNTLSAERAQAVRGALVSRGVEATRLVSAGFGSRQPAASNATAEGRARNRRIEIKVVGPNE